MRRVFLFMLVFLLATAVAGATEITWWHWNTPERQAHLEPLIKEFEQETGIKVKAERVPWAELKEKVILGLAGGVAPDVAAVSSGWGDELGEQGAFLDLRPLIEADTSGFPYDDIFPTAFKMWQNSAGEQYAFPFDLDIICLFYNRGLFDEAGLEYPDENLDWDQLLDDCIKLTQDFDGDGENDQYGWTDWYLNWTGFVWANGGTLLNEDRTEPTLDTPEAREALQFCAQLYPPFYDVNASISEANRLGAPHPPALWRIGKIAYLPAGAWAPSIWMVDPDTGEYTVDFDVTHTPKSPIGERAVKVDGQGMGILSSCDNVEAAFKFVKFLASKGVQTVSGKELGQFPVRRSIALSDAFLPPDTPPENKQVFVEAAEYARPFPKHPNWASAYSVMRSEIGGFFVGNQSLDEALANIQRRVPPILAGKEE